MRVVAGGFNGEILGGAGHVAALHERAGEVRPELRVLGVEPGGLPQRLEGVVGMPFRVERRGQPLELIDRRRALPRAREITSGNVDGEQTLTNLFVVRADECGLAQYLDSVSLAAFRRELGCDLLEVGEGALRVADFAAGPRRIGARLEVRRIETAEANPDLRGAALSSRYAHSTAASSRIAATISRLTGPSGPASQTVSAGPSSAPAEPRASASSPWLAAISAPWMSACS